MTSDLECHQQGLQVNAFLQTKVFLSAKVKNNHKQPNYQSNS